MRPALLAPALALGLAAGVACREDGSSFSQQETADLAARADRLTQRLASASTDTEPLARWNMPPSLAELSGLAVLDSTRLVTHNDEVGRVAVVDFRRGVVLKQFSLGEKPLRGDFEGVTVANGRIWLLESNGMLYEFAEGADGGAVPFTRFDTRLGNECEFEGVAFDPSSESLLLSCKRVTAGSDRDQLVIYRWSLARRAISPDATLEIPYNRLTEESQWKEIHPSGVAVDPASGNYVLVAARQRVLIEVTPAGDVVTARPLPSTHPQAEGVGITPDGLLIICDEGSTQPGTITLYRWPARTSTRGVS
jgi:uncharacterized protein YjiK